MSAQGQASARKREDDDVQVCQGNLVVGNKEDVRQRVLVVDDEVHIADTLSLILQQKGYATAVAYDGAAAVQTARQFRPHLLLSDIKMPGLNGIEAAISISEFLPRCSVLFISGHLSTQDVLAYPKSRKLAFEVCSKPVPPAALLKKIERALVMKILKFLEEQARKDAKIYKEKFF